MSEATLQAQILVAEDNAINQKVIEQQLKMLGYSAHIVADGVDALEALDVGRYSLLLTDCNMPRMDGYELAGRVRELESSGDANPARHLPIVALTANALVGEKERCQAAGMDDLLTKPTDMQQLDRVLGRYLGTEPPQPAAPAESKPQLLIDRPTLRRAVGGSAPLVGSVLLQFRDFAQVIKTQIDQADKAHDAAALGDCNARLQRAARLVGATPLADLCERYDAAGDFEQQLEQLRALLSTTVKQIRLR